MKKIENLVKETEVIKKNQTKITELKNTITEIKTWKMGLIIELMEHRISEVEVRAIELTQCKHKKTNRLKNKWTEPQAFVRH